MMFSQSMNAVAPRWPRGEWLMMKFSQLLLLKQLLPGRHDVFIDFLYLQHKNTSEVKQHTPAQTHTLILKCHVTLHVLLNLQ